MLNVEIFCRRRSNQSSLITLCGRNCASVALSAVGGLASIKGGHALANVEIIVSGPSRFSPWHSTG